MGFVENELAQLRALDLSSDSWAFVEKVAPGTKDLLERVADRYSILDAQPQDELPSNLDQQAFSRLASLVRELPTEAGLDLANERSRDVVKSFRGQLDEAWKFWRDEARAAIRAEDTRVASLIASAEGDIRLARAAREEAQTIAGQLRDLAAVAGTLELSKHYDDRAKAHSSAAKRALTFVILLSALLVVAGSLLIAFIPHTTEWTVLARDVLARGVMIGALTYLITFSARVYRTNSHLTSVYEQKVSALKTFGVFQSAVEGDEAKALLLTELVHSVFASADTGVFSKDGDTTTIVDTAAPVVAALTRGK